MAIIPTTGHVGIAAAIVRAAPWYLAIGTGSGAEAAGNTTLTTEITNNGGERAIVTPTRVDNVVIWMHQWTFTGNFTITEIGLLDDDGSPAGYIIIRHLYASSTAVTAGQKLTGFLTMTC
jgi:hypothetical protein